MECIRPRVHEPNETQGARFGRTGMTSSLVWRCTECEECRRFERQAMPASISHGKRLLAHCRACGELRILRFEGLTARAALMRGRPLRVEGLPRSA